MSAYAKKSRFTELCPVCDRLCCETRDCISKGVKDDGIYCKYWQHSFAADLMFNLFEWKTHVECLEAERDALRERCEKLKAALVEIEESEDRICSYCEGEGNRYADGKAHYYSEHAPTIPCPECGGRGRLRDMDSEDMANVANAALAALAATEVK